MVGARDATASKNTWKEPFLNLVASFPHPDAKTLALALGMESSHPGRILQWDSLELEAGASKNLLLLT